MKVKVKILLPAQASFPATAVCRVELRDVSLMDAPSVTLVSYEKPAREILRKDLLACTLEVEDSAVAGRDINVWAHLSLTNIKQIQVGDFVTEQAYPVGGAGAIVSVTLELQAVSS